jgi:thiol peroxidase
MTAKKREVRFGGRPMFLIGEEKKVGDKAPTFNVVSQAMEDTSSDQFNGKVRIISVFPSVDTPVCSRQNKRFNKEVAALGDDVAILSISVDLPFAQKRFCDVEGIKNAFMFSDYSNLDFGMKYGFLIEEMRLLGRGVVVIDKDDIIRYIEYVPEVTDEVNFEQALEAVRALK